MKSSQSIYPFFVITKRVTAEKHRLMFAIDKIFEILHNGDWHRVREVAKRIGTQESKLELISSFLSAYDFLEYDKGNRKIRTSRELQDFFGRIKEVEQREAAEKNKRSS